MMKTNDALDALKYAYIRNKPPVGTAPAWLTASRRIDELCRAIKDYSDAKPTNGTEKMREWAHEIILQCDLIDEMEGKYGGR